MTRGERWARLKPPVVAALLAIVAATTGPAFLGPRPVESWLAPHVLAAWGLAGLFALSSLAIGVRVVRWLHGPSPRDGFWSGSFAVGVLVFGIAVALAGHLGLLVQPMFWALPLALLAGGWVPLVKELVALRHAWRPRPLTGLELAVAALGGLGLLVAVVPTLAPETINYDARWYHLGLAERYVTVGAITPSLDGNVANTGPQLASLLYTWGWLLERPLFDRVLVCLQLEVVCFLGTLAAVPALARALAPAGSPPARYRLAWVTVLLFPLLYVYDTGLEGGADHIGALFAPTAFLTLLQARERKDLRSWILFGLNLGGLALVKFTSIILVAPLVLIALATALPLDGRAPRRLLGPIAAGVAALAGTWPFWLRNWLFYGNPVYPVAAHLFPTHPWTRDSALWHQRFSMELFVPDDSSLFLRLQSTVAALWAYHVNTYTWTDFTGGLPVFGSLYSIALVALPFIRGAGRLWLTALICHGAIALWFNLAHQMRYLMILIPLMGAALAVMAVEAWRWRSPVMRVAIVALVAAQVVLTADVPFLQTHRMLHGTSPLARAVTFFGPDTTGARFRAPFSDWKQIGEALPPKAVVLLHAVWPSLGIGRLVLTDTPGQQLGINYSELGSVRRVHAHLQAIGVSHLGWRSGISSAEAVAGELLFLATAALATDERIGLHGWTFGELKAEAPPEPRPEVAYVGCGRTYPSGLYQLSDLSRHVPPKNFDPEYSEPRERGEPAALYERVDYVVRESNCGGAPEPGPQFEQLGVNSSEGVDRVYYLRRMAR